MNRRLYTILLTLTLAGFLALPALAAAPVGNETFELNASPFTGSDNTGDGGTGLPANFNYYYVGQTFTTAMRIKAGGTDAANIWIDYNTAKLTASNLIDGTYYPSYSGQTIVGGRVYLTGFRTSGVSSGTGNFGWVNWTVDAPNAAGYNTATPEILDINVGTIGNTTESNIALGGSDLLDDEEDFQLHLWADTIKPFAENPSPGDTATGVSVETNYTYDLRDTLNGEGDNTGVGTGVNTAEPPGVLTFDDGGGASSYAAYDSFSCSGIWGTNYCGVTVNPPPPSGIPGDSRNFEYNTTYVVDVSGFQDLASSAQNQLGDANGPNTMNPKSWSFTTEADTVPPRVVAETPTRGSSGNSISTNITIVVHDKKTYPGSISGTGVDASTCRFNVSSPSFTLTTYQPGDAGVTTTAVDYGYQFVINPGTDFAQNETVTVSAYDCEDLASNVMITDTWTFTTADTSAPYVDQVSPADDTLISEDASLNFHIKDDGSGVDLSNVVIYVNGVYYTDGGGAGSVTTNGTRITFADSLDFNGGNYLGDTTTVSGSAGDYTFTLDPETDFTVGEAVPVLIYAKDTDGNIMERYVYALAVEDPNATGPCPACTGGGGNYGGGTVYPEINQSTISVIQIDEDSVLVSWNTNYPGSSLVLYDFYSHDELLYAPSYGYQYFTMEYPTDSLYHAVVIDGLTTGRLYYFRPVSGMQGDDYFGYEVLMAPRFASIEIPCPLTDLDLGPGTVCPVCAECSVGEQCPVCPALPAQPAQPTEPAEPSEPADQTPDGNTGLVKIISIQRVKTDLTSIIGQGSPNSTITILVADQAGDFESESSVRTDADGNWQLDLLNQLKPGLYQITAYDNQGHQDHAMILIGEVVAASRLASSLTQRWQLDGGQPLLPPAFAYAIFLLLLIIIALGANMVRLGDKIDKEITKRKRHEARLQEMQTKTCSLEEKYKKQHWYMRNATIVAAIAIVLALIFGLVLNFQAGVFDRQPAAPAIATTIVSVSGSLVSPFEEQGVPGVDVVAGTTQIRTDEGGWYSFTDIPLENGVRLTHPNLLRPIVKGLEEFSVNNQKTAKAFPVKIYFDINLFNTLTKIVDLEARGRYSEIYDQVAQATQSQITRDRFVEHYQPIFNLEDIGDQELYVATLTTHQQWTSRFNNQFNNVVAVTLSNNSQTATYYLMLVDDLWLLVQ
ncbi:hypothetical protein KJ611_02925 [Patescibacteria group bacterium]|nr:hypothetical protein [Patescibacteria group bacterium]